MKYYTKEWYNLAQNLDYVLCMKPIADKAYTDGEIQTLYRKELKAEIRRDRAGYDEPPSRMEIDFDDFDLDDFVVERNGVLTRPASMKEVKESHEEEFRRAQEEYANRPPFDPAETEENFKARYEAQLKYGYLQFPEWVKGEADIRLIALGYLPKSVYGKLKEEAKRNRAEFNRQCKAAERALKKEDVPREIAEKFCFHDGDALSLTEENGNLVMLIRADGMPFEGETPFVRVTFVGGEIVERDENLKFEHRKIKCEENEYDAYCTWLYEELYRTEDGYEAHMMFVEGELGYLTVRCKDILFEENISL